MITVPASPSSLTTQTEGFIALLLVQTSFSLLSKLFTVNVHHIDPEFLGAPASFLLKRTEKSLGSCSCLELTLHCMTVSGEKPVRFRAGHNSRTQRLSVSSFHPNDGGGSLRIEPARLRGHHIGTFLMNEIVNWGRHWPHATVNPIRLFDADADGENRCRRNRFYERFGFTFEYDDTDGTTGRSREMVASGTHSGLVLEG